MKFKLWWFVVLFGIGILLALGCQIVLQNVSIGTWEGGYEWYTPIGDTLYGSTITMLLWIGLIHAGIGLTGIAAWFFKTSEWT